jgi:hypothetical protein
MGRLLGLQSTIFNADEGFWKKTWQIKPPMVQQERPSAFNRLSSRYLLFPFRVVGVVRARPFVHGS